jgi:hypothetical protein
MALATSRRGCRGSPAWLGASLILSAGCLIAGCREAVTRPNPPPVQSEGPPSLIVHPAQDTTVDSIGSLNIEVTVHDQALIDSVEVLVQGASLAFPVNRPNDTTFHALYPVPLGPLRHQAFTFTVTAGNILGYDTTTASVTVRPR